MTGAPKRHVSVDPGGAGELVREEISHITIVLCQMEYIMSGLVTHFHTLNNNYTVCIPLVIMINKCHFRLLHACHSYNKL